MNFGEVHGPFMIDKRFLDEQDQSEFNQYPEEQKATKKKGGTLRGLTGLFKSNSKKKDA